MLPRIKSAAPHGYARINPLPGPTRSASHRDPVTQNTQHLEHNEFHRSRLPPLCPIFLHFQSFVKGSRTRLLLGGENGARRVLGALWELSKSGMTWACISTIFSSVQMIIHCPGPLRRHALRRRSLPPDLQIRLPFCRHTPDYSAWCWLT